MYQLLIFKNIVRGLHVHISVLSGAPFLLVRTVYFMQFASAAFVDILSICVSLCISSRSMHFILILSIIVSSGSSGFIVLARA